MSALLTAWSFLKSPLGRYVMIGVACVALIFGFALHERHAQAAKDAPYITDPVSHRKWKDLASEAQSDLRICKNNNTALQASVETQNAAVAALKTESDTRVAQSQKAAQSARAVAESYRQSAGAILAAKSGADKCASADALIAEAVR